MSRQTAKSRSCKGMGKVGVSKKERAIIARMMVDESSEESFFHIDIDDIFENLHRDLLYFESKHSQGLHKSKRQSFKGQSLSLMKETMEDVLRKSKKKSFLFKRLTARSRGTISVSKEIKFAKDVLKALDSIDRSRETLSNALDQLRKRKRRASRRRLVDVHWKSWIEEHWDSLKNLGPKRILEAIEKA